MQHRTPGECYLLLWFLCNMASGHPDFEGLLSGQDWKDLAKLQRDGCRCSGIVGDGYWLRIPVFGWYTASGKLLENIGVHPDVESYLVAEQLSSGCDAQLAAACALLARL